MKKKLIAALSIASIALIAAGCGTVKVPQSELDALQHFTFSNTPHENAYLSQYEVDTGISIDGTLDESIWQDNATKQTLKNEEYSTDDNSIEMKTMAYLGENGVYFAFSVKDTAVFYSGYRTASRNSSVEVYVSDYRTTEWNGNSFRISVVPTGDEECITEVWTYRPKTEESKNWSAAHVAASKINGEGINTNRNEGYDVELFIPYESFGLEEATPAIQYFTAFNHVESAGTEERSWVSNRPDGTEKKIGSWYFATNEKIGLYADMRETLDSFIKTDSYMTIDGSLSEEAWNEQDSYDFMISKSAKGVSATVSVMTHLSDLGVYVGAHVDTQKIYASSSRDVKYNTGLELWIQGVDQDTTTKDTRQIRIDALGNVAKWRWLEDNFIDAYFPSSSAASLLGCTASDGVVASDTATGFEIELFIPWKTLGFDEKQNGIAVFPNYVQALDTTSTDNSESDSNTAWHYHGLANHTMAKTKSKMAFVRFYDYAQMPTMYDGIVNTNESYTQLQTFTTADGVTATVYVKDYGYGAAIAIVMEDDYINYKSLTDGTSTGDNGGAIQILMSNSTDTTNTNGLHWRVFSDGSSRSRRDLSNDYPENARKWMPVGATNAFEVSTVAIDMNDLTKGYSKMTLEFFIAYDNVMATSVEDFYIAVGVNGTSTSTNNTSTLYWSNGDSNTSNPTATAFKKVKETNA